MNALANPNVGQYLNRHYVSGFQKVATFQIVAGQKQGGNVASYFCTPDGRVLHAVAGPVDADTFLREAQWANETYQLALLDNLRPEELRTFFRKAHLKRLQREQGVDVHENACPRPAAVSAKLLDQLLARNQHIGLQNNAKVHLLLAVGAAPRLNQVYRVVFERVLNEQIATDPVAGR